MLIVQITPFIAHFPSVCNPKHVYYVLHMVVMPFALKSSLLKSYLHTGEVTHFRHPAFTNLKKKSVCLFNIH